MDNEQFEQSDNDRNHNELIERGVDALESIASSLEKMMNRQQEDSPAIEEDLNMIAVSFNNLINKFNPKLKRMVLLFAALKQ